MNKSIGSVFLAVVLLTILLSGCAPASTPVPLTAEPTPYAGLWYGEKSDWVPSPSDWIPEGADPTAPEYALQSTEEPLQMLFSPEDVELVHKGDLVGILWRKGEDVLWLAKDINPATLDMEAVKEENMFSMLELQVVDYHFTAGTGRFRVISSLCITDTEACDATK
jgi:hypothetical protein